MSGSELTIRRGKDMLRVRPREGGGFDLSATGGGNISASELEAIEAYVAGKPGATELLSAIRRRMAR
jgi:hypothetical protein